MSFYKYSFCNVKFHYFDKIIFTHTIKKCDTLIQGVARNKSPEGKKPPKKIISKKIIWLFRYTLRYAYPHGFYLPY